MPGHHDRPAEASAGDAGVTPAGRAQQELLLRVHEHLRQELSQLRDAVAQVGAGASDAAATRSLINRLTMRQNYWTLGSFCAAYCRVVATHHTIEDEHMFPGMRRHAPHLGGVIDRLEEEHEQIAGILTALDDALVAMVTEPEGFAAVDAQTVRLSDALLTHLAYEESQLLGAIGRLTERVV